MGPEVDPSVTVELVDLLVRIDSILAQARLGFWAIWLALLYRVALAFSVGYRRGDRQHLLLAGRAAPSPSAARVAVAIPARNAARYLRSALASALSQTLAPGRVYVLDDASTDGTAEEALRLLRSLSARLKGAEVKEAYRSLTFEVLRGDGAVVEVKVVTFARHSGKPRALNHVLGDLGEGFEYLLVLDADTVLEEGYLEKVLGVMESRSDVAAVSGTVLLWMPESDGMLSRALARAFRNAATLCYFLTVRLSESILGSANSVSGCCAAYRVGAVREVGGFPEDLYVEDAAVSWDLQVLGYRVAYVPFAYAYTVDPSTVPSLFSKFLRIAIGVQTLLLTRLCRIVRARRWGLLFTSLYTCLGSVPFSLMLIETAVALVLYAVGVYTRPHELVFGALHFTSVSAAVAILTLNVPALGFVVGYAAGVLGSLGVMHALSKLNGHEGTLKGVLRRSRTLAPLVPLLLWLQAFAMLLASPIVVYRLACGLRESKW